MREEEEEQNVWCGEGSEATEGTSLRFLTWKNGKTG